MGLNDVPQLCQMILEYVAAGAGISRLVPESGTVIVGDYDDPCVRMLCQDSSGCGQTIDAPELDVHQDPGRHVRVISGDSIGSVISLDQFVSQIEHDTSDHLPHPDIVLHDQDGLVGLTNHLGAEPVV